MMRWLLDDLRVAVRALTARPGRMVLMAAGPLLGVAVIVGSMGVLQSTTGHLREALRNLGTNLVVLEAGAGRMPPQAVERVASVSTVEGVAALGTVGAALVSAAPPMGELAVPPANQVVTADENLLTELEIGLRWGRPLRVSDESTRATAVVIGTSVARRLLLEGPDLRTVYVGGHAFAIVGVLETSPLYPDIDSAVMMPRSTAQEMFGAPPRPDRLLVRVEDGWVGATAEVLADTVTYGGATDLRVFVPSDLLAARTEIDRTLSGAVAGLGLLAMVVGGFGIANVMLISVIERRREIGVRRALGHLRIAIALQFLTESALVGLMGGVAGAVVGAMFVAAVAAARDWVVILDPLIVAGSVVAAAVLSLLAGAYPASRAARLQPLDALRAE
jgi:putative ABC transport system permease protein